MIAELKEDVTSIEGFIAFSASDTGKKIFGEAQAKAMNEAFCSEEMLDEVREDYKRRHKQ